MGRSRGRIQRRRQKKRKKRGWIVVVCILSIVAGILVYKNSAFLFPVSGKGDYGIGNKENFNLYSPYMVLMDHETGNILTEEKSEERIYPASLTKIMTALVAIENLSDLDESIYLSYENFDGLYEQQSSMAGFSPGEEVSARDLLYGDLLSSGGECAKTLALEVSGSEEAFVRKMNEMAAELGLKNTHFTNVYGLHDGDHYSTVRDMAILLNSALENETFREIFLASSYTTEPTELNPDGIILTSTLFSKMDSPYFDGGQILGGKTGYTDEAGLCLATLGEKNGKEYILVTAGAKGNLETEPYHITDAFSVYNSL